MALDGITVSNIVYELSSLLKGGRMDKIYQPQKDEIVISVRNNSTGLQTSSFCKPKPSKTSHY